MGMGSIRGKKEVVARRLSRKSMRDITATSNDRSSIDFVNNPTNNQSITLKHSTIIHKNMNSMSLREVLILLKSPLLINLKFITSKEYWYAYELERQAQI